MVIEKGADVKASHLDNGFAIEEIALAMLRKLGHQELLKFHDVEVLYWEWIDKKVARNLGQDELKGN